MTKEAIEDPQPLAIEYRTETGLHLKTALAFDSGGLNPKIRSWSNHFPSTNLLMSNLDISPAPLTNKVQPTSSLGG